MLRRHIFYEGPLARGALSLALLAIAGGNASTYDHLSLVRVIVVEIIIILPSSLIWRWTLLGFLRDIWPTHTASGGSLVAVRSRRAAVAASWAGLLVTVVGMLVFGWFYGRLYDLPHRLALLCVAVTGLVVASFLPRLSARRMVRAGGISVTNRGIHVLSGTWEESDPIPFPESPADRYSEEEIQVLLDRIDTGLADGVRWRPGALRAIRRWLAEGFLPTYEETLSLGLDRVWSIDPRSEAPTRAERWRESMVFAGVSVFLSACGFGLGYFVVHKVVHGDGMGAWAWFFVIAFGWIPVVLVPGALRQAIYSLRVEHFDAGESRYGWFDLLHGRGLVPYEKIDGIEVRADGTVSVLWAEGTLVYPSNPTTMRSVRRAASRRRVTVEMPRRG